MIPEATRALIETAQRPSSTDLERKTAAQGFFDAVGQADTRSEVHGAMDLLGRHFDLEDGSRGAFLALVCSILVENGFDSAGIAEPISAQLERLAEAATDLAEACWQGAPSGGDWREAFERRRAALRRELPRESAAWESLDDFVHPALAVYARSPEARLGARFLREWSYELAEVHEGCRWLDLMLSVPHEEPFVALEPATGRGWLGHLSGVADNGQLAALLWAALSQESLPREAVPAEAIEVLRGTGPQQSDLELRLPWTLHASPGASEVVPLEGVPEHFPVVDDRRVIVLARAQEPEPWRVQRLFEDLGARLEIERALEGAETRGWLERLAAAVPDSEAAALAELDLDALGLSDLDVNDLLDP